MAEGKPPKTTVRVYDSATQRIITIPASELAPGMVFVEDENGERYYRALSTLKLSNIRHEPFDESIRDSLRRIKSALEEVYPQSLEEWEDGFRRDNHPAREIAIWLSVAELYREFTDGQALSLAKKRDYFRTILDCANGEPVGAIHTMKHDELSREEAHQVIRRCYPDTHPT